MDKAREKIEGFLLDLASDIQQYGLTEPIKASAVDVFLQIIRELGYRKLPEGKPPLLTIDEVLAEMERRGWGRTTIENRTPLDEREIQWDSDIKWYGGKE